MKYFRKDIKVEEGIKLGLEIFKDVLGDKFDIQRFDIAYIKNDEKKLKRVKGEDYI